MRLDAHAAVFDHGRGSGMREQPSTIAFELCFVALPLEPVAPHYPAFIVERVEPRR